MDEEPTKRGRKRKPEEPSNPTKEEHPHKEPKLVYGENFPIDLEFIDEISEGKLRGYKYTNHRIYFKHSGEKVFCVTLTGKKK